MKNIFLHAIKGFGWRDLAVVGSLAAVVGIVLPLQTCLGNAEIFPFSVWRLLPELFAIGAIFTVALWLIAFLAGKLSSVLRLHLLSAFYFSLLAAALVCVYLESGILSLGLPELNGGPVPELANRTRAWIDAGVWVLSITGFLVFARKLAPYRHWISLAILVLSLATLVDVTARSPDAPSREGAGRETGDKSGVVNSSTSASNSDPLSYQPQPTVVANVKYSPTRNILVFVLDSMPGRAAVDAVRTNAALIAEFPGFTAYPDNIGMHDCTKRGVPGLVTGRYYDPDEMSEADYPMTMYGTNSFVTAAAVAGWNVAFSPDLLPYGATNLPIGKRVAREEKRRSRDSFAFLRQSTEVPFLSLFDTVAFRLSPFVFKGPILYSRIRHAVKGRHSAEGFWGERTMYPELAARPVNADDPRPFLGLFHSWGVHPPWTAGFATTVTEKFKALARLMEAYRAAGVYEKSLIVVTSDHGLLGAPSPKGYPSPASALLWVKPAGATAPFAVSPLRTSHARIAPLVKTALAEEPGAAACERILRDDHPLHRSEEREGGRDFFKDWRD